MGNYVGLPLRWITLDPAFRGTESPIEGIEDGGEGGGDEEIVVGAGVGDGPGHESTWAGADFVGAGLDLLPEEAREVGGFAVGVGVVGVVVLEAAGVDEAEEVPAELGLGGEGEGEGDAPLDSPSTG